jgi:hypothetical protein
MLYRLAGEADKDIIAEASLSELIHEIQRCLHGHETGGSSQGRKAFFDRLVWLEKVRAPSHGVPAQHRRFRCIERSTVSSANQSFSRLR